MSLAESARISIRRDGKSPLPPDYFNFTNTSVSDRLVRLLQSNVLASINRQPDPKVFQKLMDGVRPTDERTVVAYDLLHELDDRVIYKDDDLLIIDKPAGIPAHGNDRTNLGVEEIVKFKKGMHVQHANRLDIHTTGVMVFANNFSALIDMSQQFADKGKSKMQKQYLAIMNGAFASPEELDVHVLLRPAQGRGRDMQEATLMEVVPAGIRDDHRTMRDSETLFKPLVLLETKTDPPKLMTLVRVQPITGRKHQIRVVAAQALNLPTGMPLLGDGLYGPDKTLDTRYMLHAHKLTFALPSTGVAKTVEAPVPADFQDMVSSMRVVTKYQ